MTPLAPLTSYRVAFGVRYLPTSYSSVSTPAVKPLWGKPGTTPAKPSREKAGATEKTPVGKKRLVQKTPVGKKLFELIGSNRLNLATSQIPRSPSLPR